MAFPYSHITITGGAGFIGSHLTEGLLARGCAVRVLDDFSTGRRGNLPAHPRLEVVTGDALDRDAVCKAAQGADLVIHMAGVVGMRLAFKQASRAHAVAAEGARNLVGCSPLARVILFSSSAVFGHDARQPTGEGLTIDRRAAIEYDGGRPGYATGKWDLEQVGLDAHRAGRKVLVVRPFNVVGPRQIGTYGMVLPTFVRRALQGQTLTIFDDGEQTRSFGDVTCFVESLLDLAASEAAWALPVPLYNVGNPSCTTINELAKLVVEEAGTGASIAHVPYTDAFPERRDVRERAPDTSRIESVIGPRRWPGVREIVRRCIESERQAAAAP